MSPVRPECRFQEVRLNRTRRLPRRARFPADFPRDSLQGMKGDARPVPLLRLPFFPFQSRKKEKTASPGAYPNTDAEIGFRTRAAEKREKWRREAHDRSGLVFGAGDLRALPPASDGLRPRWARAAVRMSTLRGREAAGGTSVGPRSRWSVPAWLENRAIRRTAIGWNPSSGSTVASSLASCRVFWLPS